MFVIRQANPDDLAAVMKLARMQYNAALATDPDAVTRLITQSRDSFADRATGERERPFLFVLEDTDTGSVVGMSGIQAFVGDPLTYFRLAKQQHYSEDLHSGHVHLTLQLEQDPVRATGLNNLVLAPAYRGHRSRLGAFLSLVRLHFIALHREWFEPLLVAELPPPVPPDRRETFWEHLGRRFVNLSLSEAERFHARSREFVPALFPKGEIYVSLLPPDARNCIGKVSSTAAPARSVLERAGLACRGRIEPFTGGPVLEGLADEVPLLAQARTATLGDPSAEYSCLGFVSLERSGTFRAVQSRFAEPREGVAIPGEAAGLLDAQVGDTLGVTASSRPPAPTP